MTLDQLLHILYTIIAIIASLLAAGFTVTLIVGMALGITRAFHDRHNSNQ